MLDNSILSRLKKAFRSANIHLTDSERREVDSLVERELQNTPPPAIAFIGLTGVGKSTTINALFNAAQDVSHTKPMTSRPEPVVGDLYEYTGSRGEIVIYDMPGLGEDLDADERHYSAYAEVIPNVDVVVWVIGMPERYLTEIQRAVRRLRSELGPAQLSKLVFAANKADLIVPRDWVESANIPSESQAAHICDYSRSVTERLRNSIESNIAEPVVYSAERRFNLELLMRTVVERAPRNRAWLFGEVANVADFTELASPEFRAWLRWRSEGDRRARNNP